MRLRRYGATSHHLQLAQFVRLPIGRLCQQHAQVAPLATHLIIISLRECGNVFPCLGIVRHLQRSCAGPIDPVQRHLVEARLTAKVHIHPFLSARGTAPGAGEMGRRQHIQKLLSVEEVPAGQLPFSGCFTTQLYAIVLIAFLLEVDVVVYPPTRHHALLFLQQLPLRPMHRGIDLHLVAFVLTFCHHPAIQPQTVGREAPVLEVQLQSQVFPLERLTCVVIGVEKVFLFILRHTSFCGRKADGGRRLCVDDTICDQLACQVVVIA